MKKGGRKLFFALPLSWSAVTTFAGVHAFFSPLKSATRCDVIWSIRRKIGPCSRVQKLSFFNIVVACSVWSWISRKWCPSVLHNKDKRQCHRAVTASTLFTVWLCTCDNTVTCLSVTMWPWGNKTVASVRLCVWPVTVVNN